MTRQQARAVGAHLSVATLWYLCLAALAPAESSAAEYLIRPDGTGDYANIQEAVDAAVDGDVILLEAGVYTGAGNGAIDLRGKEITIRSELLDPETCILDLDEGGHLRRAFIMTSGETLNTIIQAITVRDGYSSFGAVGLLEDSGATFLDCRFVENGREGSRGPFWLDQANADFYRCDFRDNISSSAGGAVYARSGHYKFESCLFSGNRAEYAGAIDSYYPDSMILIDCTFLNNEAERFSGAIWHVGYGPLSIEGCRFEGNRAGDEGGAVRCTDADMTVTGSTFVGNECGELGGAISIDDDDDDEDTFLIQKCLFVDNFAVQMGGALALFAGETTVRECTFALNRSPIASSAFIYTDVVIENSILAFSTEGDAIRCGFGFLPTVSCCDVFGNAGGDWTACIGSQETLRGNFSEDPLFCDLASGDFRLGSGSPCLPSYHGSYFCQRIGAFGGCEPPSGVDSDEVVPSELESIQDRDGLGLGIAPNPTFGVLAFHVVLDAPADVQLSIHDASGRQVLDVAEENLPQGSTRFWIDDVYRDGLAAGVYYAVVRSGVRHTARQFVVLQR